MSYIDKFFAAIPHLDPYTISEDRVIEIASFALWENLSASMGLRPSQWIDSKGDRMYAAIMYCKTDFDLSEPTLEDAVIEVKADIVAIRKPHLMGVCTFVVDGREIARCKLLSSFIKRQVKGSNKKFSKVRDVWTAEDMNTQEIEDMLARHHQVKSTEQHGEAVLSYKANRATDFNTADFMYFKNYTRHIKSAEWQFSDGELTRMTKSREAFYYGNVDDGMGFEVTVAQTGEDHFQSSIVAEDGRRIYLSLTEVETVDIPVR